MNFRFHSRLPVWSRALVALPVAIVLSGCAGGSGGGLSNNNGGGGSTTVSFTGSGSGLTTINGSPKFPLSATVSATNVITLTPIAAASGNGTTFTSYSGPINSKGAFDATGSFSYPAGPGYPAGTTSLFWAGSVQFGIITNGTVTGAGGNVKGTFSLVVSPKTNPTPTDAFTVPSGTGTVTVTNKAVDLGLVISDTGAITITSGTAFPAATGFILPNGTFALTSGSGTFWTGTSVVSAGKLTINGTLTYLSASGLVTAPFTLTGTLAIPAGA